MRPAGSQEELERRRRLAVQRVIEGHDQAEVSRMFGVSPSSVWRWVEAYRHGGWSALNSHGVAGRPPKLSRMHEKIISRWLKEPPTTFGFASDLWTTSRLCELVGQEFGVHFNADYFGTWLHQHGYSAQMPQPYPRERDPRKISYWMRVSWPRIQENAEKSGSDIAFVDESGVLMAPLLRRTWSQKGHTPAIAQKGKGQRGKVSIAAALWLSLKPRKLGLFFKTMANNYFTGFESACFIEAFALKHPRPLIVVWDRGNMHRGDEINSLRKQLSGSLHFEKLPPYAPMLNPVEYIWSWIKYDRLCNFAALDVEQLHQRTIEELDNIKDNQALLNAFMHASDVPIPYAFLS
jgi:transposase